MKAKKITAVLLIVLMLISLNPINVPACVPDPTPITVTVNVDQKHGNDTHDFANYTLNLTQAQSDALDALSNISLSDALYYSYNVLKDKFPEGPVNAYDLYGDGQIVYEQLDATHYYVYILLKEDGPFYAVTFNEGVHGSITSGDQNVFYVKRGTQWNESGITAPGIDEDAGYIFTGWDPNFNPLSTKKINKDITFTAQYAESRTVTFDAGAHGSITSGDQYSFEVLKGTKWKDSGISAPGIDEDLGYDFTGWLPVFNSNSNDRINNNVTFVAQYVKNASEWCNISFNAGANGSITPGDQTSFDVPIGVLWGAQFDGVTNSVPTPLANTGYKFDHWSPAIPAGTDSITGSQTYTANFVIDPDQWNTINFVSDGNGTLSGTTTYANILDGTLWSTAITAVPTPVADPGYKFDHWDAAIPADSSAINDNATYTAYFVIDPDQWNTINFVSNGNGTLSGTTTYANILDGTVWNTVITVPGTNAAAGYKFDHWSPSIPAGTDTISSSQTYTAYFVIDPDQWNTINFVSAGNGTLSGKTTYSDILDGTTWNNAITAVPTPKPAKGYMFDHWDPAIPAGTDTITSSQTYTAYFVKDPTQWNTIDFVSAGHGTLVGLSTTFANILDGSLFYTNVIVPLPVPEFGYKFDHWSPSLPKWNGKIYDSQTYTAYFVKVPCLWYQVDFITDGHGTLTGTASYSDILIGTKWEDAITQVPTPVANTGYEFASWTPSIPASDNLIIGDATYTADFVPIDYSISYVLNGGINNATNPTIYNIESSTITLLDPSYYGYTFIGWYDNEELTGTAVTSIPTGSTGDKKFWAKWEKDESLWNDVSFTTDGNGTLSGTTSFADILEGTIWNSVITVPTPTANTGYEFNVWSPILPATDSAINDDATYTATFSAINYDINYVLNGGINNAGNLTTYNIESSTITLLDPSYYGYTFLGWYDNEELTGTAVTTIPTGSTGDKTFYAKWEKDASLWYDVNFTTDGNGTLTGTTSFADILNGTIWNTVVTIPTATPKAGYVFNGWTPVLPAATSAITKNVTYKANFRAIVYDITYVLNDGTNSADNPATYTVNSGTITFADPTREGYTFDGWYNNADFTGDKVTRIAAGSTGDATLYAKWTANTIIDDNPVPLTPGTPVLTLIDLFCAILTLLGMIYMLTSKKNTDDENAARRRKTTRITGVVLAAVGVILFFITQPLVWNFRWVDKWTVLFIVVTLAQAAAIYIKNKANKAEATQE
ncbi:MAG: InlB B-repeat-containing protein [Eubacteriaceae bacterium]